MGACENTYSTRSGEETRSCLTHLRGIACPASRAALPTNRHADQFPFDRDTLNGDTGIDELCARDADDDDTLDGGDGTDKCVGDPVDTYITCEVRNSLIT